MYGKYWGSGGAATPPDPLHREQPERGPDPRTQKTASTGACLMARPATGRVEPEKLTDGTLAFRLRFRAYGKRENETLHERRDCDCGCKGGWTEPTAQLELRNIL